MIFKKILPKKLIKKGIALILTASIVGIMFGAQVTSEAFFDPDSAINYRTFSASTTVDNSVLFIGTYIVHKDALTDELYEKALTSASESGQNDVFYKSELSDGQWFETGVIDNGIKGISSEGLPVSIETINPLYVTYYVGADGVMKDAKTLAGVNPFDVPDPYDLSGLKELEPILTQYTMSSSKRSISQEDFLKNKNSETSGNLRSDVYYYQLLSTFFSLDLRDEETNKCDEQLKNLNSAYIALKAAGQDEQADLVYGLMAKVDATRRLLIMQRLNEIDDNLLNCLYELSTGSYYTPYGNFKDSSSESNASSQPSYQVELEDSLKHDFEATATTNSWVLAWLDRLGILRNSSGWWTVLEKAETDKRTRKAEANKENENYVADNTPSEYPFNPDSSLIEAIGTAMSNCSDSANTHRGKALVDTDDILGHVIYDYSTQVIEQTTGASVGGPVEFLKHATNIQEGMVSDKEGELSLLKSSLISLASSKYSASATAGVGSEYSQAQSEGAKKSALEGQKAKEEADRSMLQYLIEAMRIRDTAQNALEYVNDRIKWTEELLTTIPDDEYKSYSTTSVQAHLVWLKEEAQKIIDSDDSLRSKLDKLLDRKKDLQTKRDSCLDNNDLSGAAKYDALIAAVDNDIADEGGEVDNMTDKLVDKALSKLADDANADLSGVAAALAGLGETEKLNALAEKARNSGASSNTMAGIKAAQDSVGGGSGSGSGGSGSGSGGSGSDGSGSGSGGSGSGSGGSGSGSGGSGSGPDSDGLMDELEDKLGNELDDMNDEQMAVAGAVTSKLSRMGITQAESLTKKIVNKLADSSNDYLYSQYGADKSRKFVSMEALSNCTDYRYFYDDSKATATMTKGSSVYIFKRGSDEMRKQSLDAEAEKMNSKAVFSGVVYISEEDAQNYFNCTSEYAYDTNYAICLTATKQKQVDECVEELSELYKDN